MKTIMVATDFSEQSDRALRRATLLSRQFAANMVLVHVVDEDQPRHTIASERPKADKLLRDLATTLQSVDDITCESRVLVAAPFAGIAAAVEELAPDLLVLGPHRRQLFSGVFVGTSAERIIQSVACPVLTVNSLPAGHYRHVLLTSDLSDGARDAVLRFATLGIGEHALNSLLYVFDAPALRLALGSTMSSDGMEDYLRFQREDAARDLSIFVASTTAGRAEQIVRQDKTTVPTEILKVAAEIEADLIVIATQSQSGMTKLLLGSVAQKVLRTSPLDVLVIPPVRGKG